jgi:hypothetical protein
VDGLRLRRAALAEVDAEHDQAADGEELGLPVLQGLEPELCAEQEAPGRHGRLAVGDLVGAEGPRARDEMADEGEREQAEHRDAE